MENLVYVDDSLPGITRRRAGKGWAYYDPSGALIRDAKEKKRLNAIALPPAYSDAWFCPAPNGHILATGYDDAGRKQDRYHPVFRARRESAKYDACASFGSSGTPATGRSAGNGSSKIPIITRTAITRPLGSFAFAVAGVGVVAGAFMASSLC